MKELRLSVSSTGNFNRVISEFLKKFASMDKSILLKVTDDRITATMSNFEKSVIKYAETSIVDVLKFEEDLAEPLYIPLVAADKISKTLSFYNSNESVDLIITTDVIDEKLVALNIRFDNPGLTMDLPCSKISLFKISMKVTDEILTQLSETSDSIYSLLLSSDSVSKIKNLSSNNLNEELYINSTGKGVHLKGDSFELKLSEANGKNHEYGMLKANIRNIDNDEYNVYMLEERSIFKSTTNNTTIIIAKLIQ